MKKSGVSTAITHEAIRAVIVGSQAPVDLEDICKGIGVLPGSGRSGLCRQSMERIGRIIGDLVEDGRVVEIGNGWSATVTERLIWEIAMLRGQLSLGVAGLVSGNEGGV
ncbi:MAG: hypothetical protein QNJ16_21360 [Rhodobacter sp.]|nr:hypothetical protein [Rhodobacter sp.]